MNYKKIWLTICLAVAFTGTKAGNWYAGGGLNLWYESKTFSLSVNPTAGYEFNDKVAVGATLGFATILPTSTSFLFLVEPYVRYTFWSSERVAFHIEGLVKAMCANNIFVSQLGVSPGIRLFISEHCSLEANVGFAGMEYADGNFGFGVRANGTDLALGFIYSF